MRHQESCNRQILLLPYFYPMILEISIKSFGVAAALRNVSEEGRTNSVYLKLLTIENFPPKLRIIVDRHHTPAV